MAYIYQIINDINNKIYIGKTEFSIDKRFKEHCSDAFKERNEKRPLYSAMRKYGIEHFHIELIEETDNPEEREKYWIEQKQSFKKGYNATLGGDGKKYLDYNLIIASYKEIKSVKDTAISLGISSDSVSNILRANNISIITSSEVIKKKYGKVVNMYDLQNTFLKTFPSVNAAAKYMVENNLTGCKMTTIKQHITEVCMGKRKTAAKFKWKYS
jgi:hypothetical protein